MTPTDWKIAPWLCIDTETTGLDPAEGHAIVELAAVLMQAGEVIERRGTLINPERPIPAEASEVHGITDDRVQDAPPLWEAAPGFMRIVRMHVSAGGVLLAYNAPFDRRFIEATVPGWDVDAPWLDPLVTVRTPAVGKFWPGAGRHKLTAVCDRLSIEAPGPAHRASADAIMAGLVMWALRDELPDGFSEAVALQERQRAQQDEDFRAWKARQERRAGK